MGISGGVFIFHPSDNGWKGGGRMSSKKNDRIESTLKKLAYGNVSDAVSLLFLSDETALEKLPKLNLFNVSEIKRPRGGGMEIKFFDRIKACEKLREYSPSGDDESLSFYQALEKSVENTEGVASDG